MIIINMLEKFIDSWCFVLLLIVVSFMAVWISYPQILKLARRWNVMDNPNNRKLQRNSVPVLGGVAVFIGILVGMTIVLSVHFQQKLLVILLAMSLLMAVGTLDDKFELSVWIRFAIEILVVLGMIMFNGNMIDNFHGVFGLYSIPDFVALPLSVFVGVGIINSINMIDGIDGYSSGFIMLSCLLFSIVFHISHIYVFSMLCLVSASSLVPFYLHNVYGKKTKMFIGDGGTLMFGTLMVALVFSTLRTGSFCEQLEEHNVSLVALCLSILSVPVIDTLRVMTYRMVKGISPFKPDKTHMHHIFIDLHFSHVVASSICIMLNGFVLVAWMVSWLIGANVNTQFVVVCVAMVIVDPVLYAVLRYHEKRKDTFFNKIRRFSIAVNPERMQFWKWMNRLVDEVEIEGNASSKANR